jgi:hypothetical protein
MPNYIITCTGTKIEWYEESNVQMKQFASMKPNDQRAIDFIADRIISQAFEKEKLFMVNKLEINSEKLILEQ